jgi:hypothetical protein
MVLGLPARRLRPVAAPPLVALAAAVSVMSWLHARNQQQRHAIDARASGWDPVTADVIARRIEAEIEPCPGLVHEAACARCFAARYLRWAARIARQTGGLL